VAYSPDPAHLWEDFARLVLEASYEAVICAAILNWQTSGNNRAFLTLLGGGAFGNKPDWIIDGLRRALKLYEDWHLELAIVSFGRSKHDVVRLVAEF
jgi:hypothetical protein